MKKWQNTWHVKSHHEALINLKHWFNFFYYSQIITTIRIVSHITIILNKISVLCFQLLHKIPFPHFLSFWTGQHLQKSRFLIRRKLAYHISFRMCQKQHRTVNSSETSRSFPHSFPSSEVFIISFHVPTPLNSKDMREVPPSHFILISSGNCLTLLCNFPCPFLKERVTTHELTGPSQKWTVMW